MPVPTRGAAPIGARTVALLGLGAAWTAYRPRRTRKPASSSTAARNRPQSMQGNRRTPSHDYSCCTCHSRSSPEFIKTFGIGLSERGGHRRGQALERKPSNAWARKIPALNRPKKAVTVSIIAKILRAPARTQRHDTAHSQKDSETGPKIRPE